MTLCLDQDPALLILGAASHPPHVDEPSPAPLLKLGVFPRTVSHATVPCFLSYIGDPRSVRACAGLATTRRMGPSCPHRMPPPPHGRFPTGAALGAFRRRALGESWAPYGAAHALFLAHGPPADSRRIPGICGQIVRKLAYLVVPAIGREG